MAFAARVFLIETIVGAEGNDVYHIRLVSYDNLPQIEKVDEKPQKIMLQMTPQTLPTVPTKIYTTKMDIFFDPSEWEKMKNILVVGSKIMIEFTANGIKFKNDDKRRKKSG